MILNWPQLLIILLTVSGLMVSYKKHGTSEVKTYHVGMILVTTGLIIFIYYMGNFFNTMGLPQLALLVVMTAMFTCEIMDINENKTYNIYKSLATSLVIQSTLVTGGFYGSVI